MSNELIPTATCPPDLMTGGQDLFARVVSAAFSSLSDNSRRVYTSRLSAFRASPFGGRLDRESVAAYVRSLSTSGASSQVINQTISAIKRFAYEASELGWIDERSSAAISRIKTKRTKGIRTGRWLTVDQVRALIASIDRSTPIGRRDAALMALLIGCGLRRFEAVDLVTAQFEASTADRPALLRNIAGKGNRTRTVAVPRWAEKLISDWIGEKENDRT